MKSTPRGPLLPVSILDSLIQRLSLDEVAAIAVSFLPELEELLPPRDASRSEAGGPSACTTRAPSKLVFAGVR
jgi:hypothetical protein